MATVFLVQTLFPTNLKTVTEKQTSDIIEIAVTTTSAEQKSTSYVTTDTEEIDAFLHWASDQKLRLQSIANGLNANVKQAKKYNFAITSSDYSLTGIVIDEEGYVHIGAELYKIVSDKQQFIAELLIQLSHWKHE